mgnify:CR=1 FL=1
MIKRRSFITLILLSIITCGIYGIFFWYSYTDDLNTVCNGDGKQTRNYLITILLSIITCGIYYWIWLYGVGNRLYANAPRYRCRFTEDGTTILLWMIIGSLLCGFGTLYAQYILVRNMNSLAEQYNYDMHSNFQSFSN